MLQYDTEMSVSNIDSLCISGGTQMSQENNSPVQETEKIKENTDSGKRGRIISIVLSVLLALTLIPSFIFAIFSLIPTIMMSDSGLNLMVWLLMLLSFTICWGIPIGTFFVIILAWRFRVKGKIKPSIIVQSVTLVLFLVVASYVSYALGLFNR